MSFHTITQNINDLFWSNYALILSIPLMKDIFVK